MLAAALPLSLPRGRYDVWENDDFDEQYEAEVQALAERLEEEGEEESVELAERCVGCRRCRRTVAP